MPFCLQSCVKPLEYAVAVHEAGSEEVHRYVGKEPSGLKFNKLSLDEDGKISILHPQAEMKTHTQTDSLSLTPDPRVL